MRAKTSLTPPRTRQSGITLIIAMVMLVALTLFGVTMIKLSGTSLEVVGNMQAQKSTESAAQLTLEDTISSVAAFDAAVTLKSAGGSIVCGKDASGADVNWTEYPASSNQWVCNAVVNAYKVAVTLPECLHVETASGYAIDEIGGYAPPEDSVWDIKAVGTDTLSGAESEVHQGIKMRRTQGNCPV